MDTKAMYKFSSGLYVVSSEADGEVGACIINTGLQITSEPLQVQAVINKQNHTEQVVEKAGHFAITMVTEEADMPYIGRFGFRTSAEVDKFADIETARTTLGDPYTPVCAAAVLSCKVVKSLDVGTHVMFAAEVVNAEVISDAAPMTYSYYHNVLRGKTPPKASSYVAE